MPQKPKGDRAFLGVRIPRAYMEKLERYTGATRQSKTDVVSALVIDYLDNHAEADLESRGQTTLELEKVS